MKILLIILSFLFISSSVFGANIIVKWDAQQADGFKIEQSVDLGATWGSELDIPDGTATSADVTVPDNTLTLIRVGAYNSVGTAWRLNVGVWAHSGWNIPDKPKMIGVE